MLLDQSFNVLEKRTISRRRYNTALVLNIPSDTYYRLWSFCLVSLYKIYIKNTSCFTSFYKLYLEIDCNMFVATSLEKESKTAESAIIEWSWIEIKYYSDSFTKTNLYKTQTSCLVLRFLLHEIRCAFCARTFYTGR